MLLRKGTRLKTAGWAALGSVCGCGSLHTRITITGRCPAGPHGPYGQVSQSPSPSRADPAHAGCISSPEKPAPGKILSPEPWAITRVSTTSLEPSDNKALCLSSLESSCLLVPISIHWSSVRYPTHSRESQDHEVRRNWSTFQFNCVSAMKEVAKIGV